MQHSCGVLGAWSACSTHGVRACSAECYAVSPFLPSTQTLHTGLLCRSCAILLMYENGHICSTFNILTVQEIETQSYLT